MSNEQKVFDQTDNGTKAQFNQSNPIAPRKTSNRLYGGYNASQKFQQYQNAIDPVEVFGDFCNFSKNKENSEEILNYLHFLAVSKLGYNFTAVGLLNHQSNYLTIRLLDQVGNVFSSKILLSEENNPIVQCFMSKTIKNVKDINFINVPHLHNSPGLIIPLINQNNSIGVFIAGSKAKNQQNDNIMNILADYLGMFIVNKQLNEKSRQNANLDPLTGLINHRDLLEKLQDEIKVAEKDDHPISVIMLDINNMTQINDEFGPSKGDEAICLVADKIKQNIRSFDTAGRYGWDEMAVIMPNTTNAEACYIAELINHSISCSLIDDIGTVKVSVGVSTYPDCATIPSKLLLLGEQAMLISKKKSFQTGASCVLSSQTAEFWEEIASNSLAQVLARKHNQWGLDFREEFIKKLTNDQESASSTHIVEVVTSLACAIDAKDTYTRGHSQAVSRYAEALARALDLPESEVERIKLGALLHDVGKIGIEEPILRKTSALTDDEWQVMKQHPQIGAEKVLQPIHSLRDLIPMVVHHHEHWDGSGYPNKLKGEEIPLAARIISVADCFHALISDRPYRKGLSLDRAVEILKAGSGIQWDRELVRKFIIIAPSLCTTV